MTSSAVRVVLRARPSDGTTGITFLQDKKSVSIVQQKSIEGRPGAAQPASQSYQFKFDNVLASATQEEVFEAAAAEVVRGALEGYNGTIMCYGQTGAGKTFTMSGGKQSYKQRGIIPRALERVFAEVKAMPDQEAKISIQYLEIYNEALYDLLDITTQPHEICIYESSRGLVTVSGLRTAVVASEAEALALLFEGETNRVIGEHQLNRESSRSHSIFTVMIELRPVGESGGDVLQSRVALVDLAGSERVSKTRSEGLVLREAGHINKSLSILEQVILGLGDKNRDHVPFRSCKLTHVLKNSLGGNCRTVLVANVWSDAAQTDETLGTCRFAQRMSRVTCEVCANVVADSSARVRQLERQVAELQQELAMHDAMAMRSGVQYTPYNEAQRTDLRSRVLDFLMGKAGGGGGGAGSGAAGGGGGGPDSIEPLELHSLRHMREILLACRHLYLEALRGAPRPPDLAAAATTSSAGEHARRPSCAGSGTVSPLVIGGAAAAARRPGGSGSGPFHDDAPGTGGTERLGGAGVAPDDARPDVMGELEDGSGAASLAERLLSQQGVGTSGGGGGGGGERGLAAAVAVAGGAAAFGGGGGGLGVVAPDRLTALEDYKSGPGCLKARLLADNRSKLRASRARARELGLAVNGAKRELDGLKARGEELRRQRVQQRGEGAQVLDAEEYDILMRIKELKVSYKENYNELQLVKSEVDYTQGLVDQCNRELLLEFAPWYENTYGRPPADDDGTGGGGDTAAGYGSPPRGPSPSLPRSGLAATMAAASAASRGTPSRLLATSAAAGRAAAAGLTPPSPNGSVASAASGGSRGSGAAGAKPRLSQGSGVKVPLSSLVSPPAGPSGEEMSCPQALAYYNAQQMLLQKTGAGPHRPGSVKKTRPGAAFGAGAARPAAGT